jgi:type I restriction enzyme, S subunit
MKNWDVKKLGEVCSFFNGQAHEKCIDENGKYKLINSKFVSSEGENFKSTNNALSPLFVNDIVMVMSDVPNGKTLAKCFVVDKNDTYTLNQRICVIRSTNFDTRFLYYQLNRNKYLLSFDNGENQTNLRKDDILNCDLFVPPLPEQQRIVSILDEAFAAIAKAKANAEQNLKNAKELFESYLQGVFENGDWETKSLGSLCDLITKGSSPKWQGINYVDEPGILFVTSENVGEGELLIGKRKYVEEKFNQKDKKSILKNGDVLTNIVGASIGRTAIYNIDDVANINQAVCLLRCNPELINNRFLMNLLNSPFLKAILHDNEVNTARANLSLGFFNQLEIPCPTIKQQQTIVRQLDALRAETQKLEAVYQKKLDDLEELKKSILQKAFSGELKTEK